MRVDPLLLLTVAGLAGAGLLAVMHPVEDLDTRDPTSQAGRHVRATLIVDKVQAHDDWWRGTGIPVNEDGHAQGAALEWVWFRPPEHRALRGDRLVGQALVERDGHRASLLLDGPNAATLVPGPHPVAVSWADLLADPAGLRDRLLVLNGALSDGALVAPDGSARCPLTPDPPAVPAVSPRWLVRLQPDPHAPAWRCHVEGAAP